MSSPAGVFELFSNPSCTVPSNGEIQGSSGNVYVLISDWYGNSLPAETIVKTLDDDAINMAVSEFSSAVPNTPNAWCIGLGVAGTAGSAGSFQIEAETKEKEKSGASFTINFQ